MGIGWLPLTNISDSFVEAWLALEARAADGNAYLSPHFILPAVRHLQSEQRLLQLAITMQVGDQEILIGTGTFEPRSPGINFVLPHLRAYQPLSAPIGGLLLDRDHLDKALAAIGAYLASTRVKWSGLDFENVWDEGVLGNGMPEVAGAPRLHWGESYRHSRAVLAVAGAAEMAEVALADGKFGKELKRKQRRLEEMGQVSWRLYRGAEVTEAVVENFLKLEHQGWKAEHGTSLLSNAKEADFFRETSAAFAHDGRAFFTELALDGRPIAATSNYISGDMGFAFKIGWDATLSAISPGLLNELEFMRQVGRLMPDVRIVDSGAVEGSFIDRLWRERVSVATGVLAAGLPGRTVLPAIAIARKIKQAISNRSAKKGA